MKKFCTWLKSNWSTSLEVLGFLVSGVALFVSCEANKIASQSFETSEKNQHKIERLECFDKVERLNQDLVSTYRVTLVSATMIHNYLKKQIDYSDLHTEFQSNAIQLVKFAKELERTVGRFEFKCDQKVKAILNEVKGMSSLTKGVDAFDSFGGFNSKIQDKHQENINWLFETDVADLCCKQN